MKPFAPRIYHFPPLWLSGSRVQDRGCHSADLCSLDLVEHAMRDSICGPPGDAARADARECRDPLVSTSKAAMHPAVTTVAAAVLAPTAVLSLAAPESRHLLVGLIDVQGAKCDCNDSKPTSYPTNRRCSVVCQAGEHPSTEHLSDPGPISASCRRSPGRRGSRMQRQDLQPCWQPSERQGIPRCRAFARIHLRRVASWFRLLSSPWLAAYRRPDQTWRWSCGTLRHARSRPR